MHGASPCPSIRIRPRTRFRSPEPVDFGAAFGPDPGDQDDSREQADGKGTASDWLVHPVPIPIPRTPSPPRSPGCPRPTNAPEHPDRRGARSDRRGRGSARTDAKHLTTRVSEIESIEAPPVLETGRRRSRRSVVSSSNWRRTRITPMRARQFEVRLEVEDDHGQRHR